jgi:hypothetical protein
MFDPARESGSAGHAGATVTDSTLDDSAATDAAGAALVVTDYAAINLAEAIRARDDADVGLRRAVALFVLRIRDERGGADEIMANLRAVIDDLPIGARDALGDVRDVRDQVARWCVAEYFRTK